MHFAYTAPLPTSIPSIHFASISGDLGPALLLLAFAAFVVLTALSGARATSRGDLDARHRGQPLIAPGGPVTAAIRNRQPRDARGRFVKAA